MHLDYLSDNRDRSRICFLPLIQFGLSLGFGLQIRIYCAACFLLCGGYVFETERGTPFTTDAINRLIKRIGERTGFPFKVHIHMLRHACGYALANAGHDTRAIQDWLGHRAIQHTARYTELSQERFKDFWRT